MEPSARDQSRLTEERAIRLILRDTAGATGTDFFRALVRNLAELLNTDGCWVTEYLPAERKLRAFAFWLKGEYIHDFEYVIDNTACADVVENLCRIHIPERVVELYPADPDLVKTAAVSYLGVPLLDQQGGVMGHLSVLDSKPMPESPELFPLFDLFAERAAAECRRLRIERAICEREELLSRILHSATEAILVLDDRLTICRANPASAELTGEKVLDAKALTSYLANESVQRLREAMRQLEQLPPDRQRLWISGLIEGGADSRYAFLAEATLARFESREGPRYTLILRDIRERLEAERRIEELSREAEYLREEVREAAAAGEMLGKSPGMLKVYDAIARVAPADTTVLIHGETGTGKELVARAIHRSSARAGRPLVRVNCAAIPQNLMESEFFGHEKGAFTGATQRREGRFSLADGGTIFLDEIGEMPLDLQAKLLRVLQEGEFEPLGSSRTVKVNVRVIAATNRDLEAMVREGHFREDLFYRLSVFPVTLPPLRERGNDVVVLAGSFAQQFARRMGRHIDPLLLDDMQRLKGYHWPGNVRELQNVIERAIILARGNRLDLKRAMPVSGAASPGTPEVVEVGPTPEPNRVLTDGEMRELERRNILRALDEANGKISGEHGAASRLGLPPSTLSSRMKALGIRPPSKTA